MKVTAVICEYNLFHAGHARLAHSIRSYWAERGEECAIVALMSGNYVQRGEMAILPKYLRAEAAVRAGVDLVLELPYPWSGGAAEYFAGGAVSLLCALGGIDALAFGSESGDLAYLERTAQRMSDPLYLDALATARAKGGEESELRLRERVYTACYSEPFPLRANDLLGMEYLRALSRQTPDTDILPITFARRGEETATETRRRLLVGASPEGLIPPQAAAVFYGQQPVLAETIGDAFLAAMRLGIPADFSSFEGAESGLAARLCRAAREASDLSSMLALCATKRYTHAHIRRTLYNCFFGVTQQQLRQRPLWTEVLACNALGCTVLRRFGRDGKCVVLTKPSHFTRVADADFSVQHALSRRADALYAQAMREPADLFLRATPFVLEKE